MTGAGENAAPAVAVSGGWVWITRAVAAAGATVNTLLTPLLKPEALAVSCLLVPAASMRRLVNVATPLPAEVPMFRPVVPCSGLVPEVSDKVSDKVGGRPRVELLPNWSWLRTTGCVPKIQPAVALPGCVVK